MKMHISVLQSNKPLAVIYCKILCKHQNKVFSFPDQKRKYAYQVPLHFADFGPLFFSLQTSNVWKLWAWNLERSTLTRSQLLPSTAPTGLLNVPASTILRMGGPRERIPTESGFRYVASTWHIRIESLDCLHRLLKEMCRHEYLPIRRTRGHQM